MIKLAQTQDLDQIMSILKDVIDEMKDYGNTQWNDDYPNRDTFANDINNKTLYVLKEADQVKAFICLDYTEPSEYRPLKWSKQEKALVIHRMAISCSERGKGYAKTLIEYAKELAQENNVSYLKTDTYSLNTKMNSLFKTCGFVFVEEMDFLNKPYKFYTYEMVLDK